MRTLNIDECAAFLNINVVTAYKMAKRGELPGAKIGRAWVFLEDDLVTYLRAEVCRQQQVRIDQSEKKEPGPLTDLSKIDIISCFPAIRRKSGGRRWFRTPHFVLPDIPES